MLRITLKQLEYFAAAAEDGSITQASHRIGISQPAISAAISFLEQELGVTLFVRQHAQGLSLTPAGARLLAQVKAMLELGVSLYDLANELNATLRGTLTAGCLLTLAPLILPQTCQVFAATHPDVQLNLFEGSQDQLIRALRRAEVDITITYDMHLPDDLEFTSLVSLPPYLLIAADHPLSGRKSVTLREVAKLPYVLLDLPHSREYFLSLFAREGLEPHIAMRSTQAEVVRSMVANGYGVTISVIRPRTRTALDGKALGAVPLGGGLPPLPLGFASVSGLRKSTLLQAFEQHLHDTVTASAIPGMDLDFSEAASR